MRSDGSITALARRLATWPVPRDPYGHFVGTLSTNADDRVSFTNIHAPITNEMIDKERVSEGTLKQWRQLAAEKALFAQCIAHLWQQGELLEMTLAGPDTPVVLGSVLELKRFLYLRISRGAESQGTNAAVFCHNGQTYAIENAHIRLQATGAAYRGYELVRKGNRGSQYATSPGSMPSVLCALAVKDFVQASELAHLIARYVYA